MTKRTKKDGEMKMESKMKNERREKGERANEIIIIKKKSQTTGTQTPTKSNHRKVI